MFQMVLSDAHRSRARVMACHSFGAACQTIASELPLRCHTDQIALQPRAVCAVLVGAPSWC